MMKNYYINYILKKLILLTSFLQNYSNLIICNPKMSVSNNKFSFVYFGHFLKQTLINHFQLLLLDFDPVKDASRKPEITKETLLNSKLQNSVDNLSTQSKLNTIFLFPMISMVAISIETLFIYFQASYQRKPEVLNYLLARRIFPPSFWAQSDAMVHLGQLMTTIVYPCLLFDTNQEQNKYNMYLFTNIKTGSPHDFEIIQNGRLLSKKETLLIGRYRCVMNRLIRWTIFSIFLLLITFFGNSFFLTWSPHVGLNSFKFVESVLFTVYLPLTNVYMIFYFLLVVRYIRIKQGCLQDKITQFEKLITGNQEIHNHQGIQQQHYRLWKSLNVEIASIHDEIRGHNRFWSKYLTLYFALYIMEVFLEFNLSFSNKFFIIKICYFTYGVLFTSERLLDKVFFAFFAIEFSFLLLIVTLECSQLVAYNKKSYWKMRRLLDLQLQSHNNFLRHLLSVNELLKLDRMAATSRDVASVCFKLLNNYHINSQMFQLVSLKLFYL